MCMHCNANENETTISWCGERHARRSFLLSYRRSDSPAMPTHLACVSGFRLQLQLTSGSTQPSEGDRRGPRAPPRSFFLQSEEDATAVAPQELTRLEFAKGRTCASAKSARSFVRPSYRPPATAWRGNSRGRPRSQAGRMHFALLQILVATAVLPLL